jgi:tetratricopeptide (TPR) repeat protein
MRRVLLVLALVAVAGLSALGYATYTREVEYRRQIARGEAAVGAHDLATAIEAFSGAIALRPDAMLGWYKRGETYQLRGDLNAALRDLREANQRDATALRPLELLGDVLFALERYPRATERYEQYLALDDRSSRVCYKLGLSRFREGRLDGAEQALSQAVRLQDGLPEAHYLLGLCLTQRNRLVAAQASLKRAVDLDPTLVEARESLAEIQRRLGRRTDEVRQLEALVDLEPSRPERVVALAQALDRQGHRDAALQLLGRAARQFEQSALPYVALGRMWLDTDRDDPDPVLVDKAIEALTRAVASDERSESLTLLGRAWLRKGDRARALTAFEQATKVLPVDPDAFALLGETAERAGKTAQARDALVRASALAGDSDARAATRRAWRIGVLSTELADVTAADYWLTRAAATVPDDGSMIAQIAEAQWRAGLEDDARATLARGLARLPQDGRLLEVSERFR